MVPSNMLLGTSKSYQVKAILFLSSFNIEIAFNVFSTIVFDLLVFIRKMFGRYLTYLCNNNR